MKTKRIIIILSSVAVIAIIVGIALKVKTNELSKNKIEIIDATYSCSKTSEKFYEADNYIYSFPCANNSNSVFVKFPNGNKMLVTTALEEKKITIDELIKAGLEVYKTEK